jgi:hypothetical protein
MIDEPTGLGSGARRPGLGEPAKRCEHDSSTTAESMAGTAERIPAARYQGLAGRPHMRIPERSELVFDALNYFVPRDAS